MRSHSPTIIDIEASGFGPESYPIEIGVVNTDGARFCSLIQPFEDWQHWSGDAERAHGITRASLFKHGKQGKTVCRELNEFLYDQDVFCDALAQDEFWIRRLFYRSRIVPAFRLRAIEYIMHEAQYEIWDQTKAELSRQLQLVRHRASSDAYLIQQTFALSRSHIVRSARA